MALTLLDRLKQGRDALGHVTVNGVDIGLRLLNEQDRQQASMAADKLLADANTEITMSNAEAYEAEKALTLMYLAMVDPATRKAVFVNADEARVTLIRPDVEYIVEAYVAFEKQFSPSPDNMPDAEFTALVEDVKKNPQTPPLKGLNFATLTRLISTLANPPAN